MEEGTGVYLKWRSANLYSGRFAFVLFPKPSDSAPFKMRLDKTHYERVDLPEIIAHGPRLFVFFLRIQ